MREARDRYTAPRPFRRIWSVFICERFSCVLIAGLQQLDVAWSARWEPILRHAPYHEVDKRAADVRALLLFGARRAKLRSQQSTPHCRSDLADDRRFARVDVDVAVPLLEQID